MNKQNWQNIQFVTVKEAQEIFHFSYNSMRDHAKEAGALLKFGRSYRIDLDKMKEFIEKQNN